MFPDALESSLIEQKDKGRLRLLTSKLNLIDFSSNDYLGLARNPDLKNLIHQKFGSPDLLNGATGSRLLTGNSDYTKELEEKLAIRFNSESALLFNSGYFANLSVLSSIPNKGDTIIYDELSHASIKDGVRLSLAKRFKFKHNDLEDLEKKIKNASGQIYIVVESIYSMDGDFCPLQKLVILAKKYTAVIILDEAHSTGIVGENGSGLASSLKLEKDIAIRIHTFGKAMGVHGACVCGSQILIDYLINFARPFIYTTALPPHNIASVGCAFEYSDKHPELQQQLDKNISIFIDRTHNLPFVCKNLSSIQTVIIPGNMEVRSASTILEENGFDVRPILSPTVAEGKERLRICIHAFNTEKEIRKLTDILAELG